MYIQIHQELEMTLFNLQFHILYTKEELHLIDDRLQKLFYNVFMKMFLKF